MSIKYNLKNYKEAKAIGPHLDAIDKVISLSIKGLTPFKAYIPVAKIIATMVEQKSILDIHREKYKKIIQTKGLVNE